ncbi:MAG: D-aminoacyl-tRNA deacylase [Albidovulum sp.]|nr:D-aminoacyl-tRNA deacylase [Albidovulum sp.]
MRCLVQRAASAKVSCHGRVVGEIGEGLLILICGMKGDTDEIAHFMANKVAKLRVFRDSSGKMKKSVLDTGGAMLVVSQFTLAADTSRGNRPGFQNAAVPTEGERLYRKFIEYSKDLGIRVAEGLFGGDMLVEIVNDGPVTIWLEKI